MEFNPYSEWLGIPPSQVPPTHYRLLGIRDFETEPGRIDRAARTQESRLRLHRDGLNASLSQQLLHEIEEARITLTDPARKADYDRQLRRGTTPLLVRPDPALILPETDTEEVDLTSEVPLDPIADSSRRLFPLSAALWAAFATVLALAILAGIILAVTTIS
jgi:hypothetical protein